MQHGFSIEAVDALFALGDATPEELHLLVGDPDALVFHERKDEALSPAESDRLARVARVIDLSETVFGKREKARRWLRKANHGLGGHVPWSLLRTEVGGRIVERALTGLAHGVIA
ncbi:antitoxin Xre/MbcA/ParS toxin-binding domain-containing protein [Longimicrobium sp.]|uniref:antitoxin Xre/MbcA/ParS toxin-binding domain-containing protein n=1 Tax=Longimicrobium sp. TaxID=2029185 RepID=UPI002E359A5C|nr:antitoxin Xre/MbcA/ParS toxin-binding domain-containing protein [Longimicrobium sp.]HEX6040249.1 antitoxin Xre/MbcA/ParS toxin-binding domain-containing protein [Longimicrobium sp.]